MSKDPRTPETAELTELVFEVFRLHGELIAMGDRMVAPFGLTSARWQVIGAVDEAGEPLTVPTIARTLGVSRQAVQRVVGELQRDGLVEPRPNPHHKTAKLIAPTARGQDAVDAATRRFTHWANRATADLDADRMKAARRLLETLRERVRAYDPEAP